MGEEDLTGSVELPGQKQNRWTKCQGIFLKYMKYLTRQNVICEMDMSLWKSLWSRKV